MEPVLTSIIAVIGTLLGSVTAYALQQRAARTERAEARSDELRGRQLAAVADLVSALADHRRAMWVREDLTLSGANTAACEKARATSHDTRSAITVPLLTVTLLAPVLAEAAQVAAKATYALRGAADRTALDALRTTALVASDRLVAEAADALAA
ncbi:protein kilB [Streptomyces sp. N2A]|uniref:protein kilB n=1 Tax=Streptomyces sp. N2A TaxID=3073936 RepID=UPI00287086CE|nr:protein kilB [Streptomyces sp. N2A]